MIDLGLVFAFFFTQGLGPLDVGITGAASLSAERCQACHDDEAAEWRHSRHGQAFTNGIFLREYREKPREWCVHCHAPLAEQLQEVRNGGGELAREGVNCAGCHIREGRILATRKRAGSPHETQVRADFGGPAFCAGCHEFNFPVLDREGHVERYTAYPMQATASQFLAGPYATVEGGCRSCHATSPAGHAYPGAHDPLMLERALTLSACREGDLVRVSVANLGSGHSVPTGDVHRHILLRVWRSSAPERLFEAYFGRRFEPVEEGGKKTTWDSTIKPRETRTFRLVPAHLGGESDEPIRFELTYVYTIDEVPKRRQGGDPGEPTSRRMSFQSARPRDLASCAGPP
jgi:hypothetical protein